MPIIPDLTKWNAAYLAKQPDTADRMPAKLGHMVRCHEGLEFLSRSALREPCYMQNIPPDYKVGPNGWVYTANHPPLYHLYMTPVYWLTESLPGRAICISSVLPRSRLD